jgi:hypothetical protein
MEAYKQEFKPLDKVIYKGQTLTVVNPKGFYINKDLYIPCADKDNIIDDYNVRFLIKL